VKPGDLLKAKLVGAIVSNPIGWKIAAGALAALFALVLFAGLIVSQGRDVALAAGGAECTGSIEGGKGGPPPEFVPIYTGAAERYKLGERGPGILAAIHGIENGFSPGGGPTSSAGAVGPMQFIPSTWAAYGADGDGDGTKDINDVDDAIYGAANYLSASGAPKDWRGAIFSYNHADWYVNMVLEDASKFEGKVTCELGANAPVIVGGPAELKKALTLTEPRTFTKIPLKLVSPGHAQTECDTRLIGNVVWILQTYRLIAWDCRASGHSTHGAGYSIDIVPEEDPHPTPGDTSRMAAWARVKQLAYDLGWRETCKSSGCYGQMVPAIQAAFYNGYSNHGDPSHYSGGCGCPHIHVSWRATGTESSLAASALEGPRPWVKAFPSPGIPTGGS